MNYTIPDELPLPTFEVMPSSSDIQYKECQLYRGTGDRELHVQYVFTNRGTRLGSAVIREVDTQLIETA
ncbi:hypothetical protein [Streptomyces scabiei]|uniref:hypothetical protein n=1 Tax=Streptomyces scabiei TaxID=1930 RepID=UPI001B329B97|nr:MULTISPECIES: hypothetical protein [Streptomyces]MBP5895217.1 hypothetical protein [Streptomyces sp. LBUM 1481]MDX2684096.1 hypothetical protein [Streptomyces scabiei]MDX2748895.1 hypothetical protein [Streptomyces scabiei]MDX2803084.1 hypothetical protein [Streptomyces scabiei]MDX3120275.1 hypothetical protein [Streptomyces scabiei]